MATNPMLQAVLLFHHHQVNTPYMPHQTVAATRAAASEAPTEEEKEDEEKKDEEEEKEGEEEANG